MVQLTFISRFEDQNETKIEFTRFLNQQYYYCWKNISFAYKLSKLTFPDKLPMNDCRFETFMVLNYTFIIYPFISLHFSTLLSNWKQTQNNCILRTQRGRQFKITLLKYLLILDFLRRVHMWKACLWSYYSLFWKRAFFHGWCYKDTLHEIRVGEVFLFCIYNKFNRILSHWTFNNEFMTCTLR